MTRAILFRKAVARYLTTGDADLLRGADEAEWNRHFWWLDRSGLALPLAARAGTQDNMFLPQAIADALQTRLADNAKRMEKMLHTFEEVSNTLNDAGVRYCCVKGFSLVPDCFADMRERHQVDLDFLIDLEGADAATAALEAAGYPLVEARHSGELRFAKPRRKHLGVRAWLYQLPESPEIELHTRVWEPEAEAIDFPEPGSFLDKTEMHTVAGVRFPRLTAPFHFVYLLLHVFRHLIASWTRLLSIYEIAMLLRSRREEDATWAETARVLAANRQLASACALVLGMTVRVFDVELPEPLRKICEENLSEESVFWLEKYSDAWLFTDPPGNKLTLLVQRQFCPDHNRWRRYIQHRLLPLHGDGIRALNVYADDKVKKILAVQAEDLRYRVGHVWYHLRSDFEYLAARMTWPRFTSRAANER
jgi:hypothetical protein